MTVLNPPPPQIGQLVVFGHSRVAEGGASLQDWGVSHKTARRLGASLSLPANGGSMLCLQEGASVGGSTRWGGIGRLLQFVTNPRTAAPYMPAWQAAILDWGLNDMAWMGPTTFASVFPLGLRGAIARMRAGRIFEDSDAAITYTGASWAVITPPANGAYHSGTTLRSVATNGDSLSVAIPADFPGGALGLRFVTSATGSGALWTITGTGSCAGVNTTYDTRNINGFDNGSTIAATGKILNSVKRLTGLPSGSGTLVATATTIQGNGYFDCCEIESPYPGPLAAGLDAKPVDYSIYTGMPYVPTDTDATAIWNTINTVCAEFTDGYAFGLACDDLFNKNPVYFADGAHWNDLGHSLAADRFASTIQAHSNPLRTTQSGGMFKPWFYSLDGTGPVPYATGWADFGSGYEKGGYRKDNVTGRVQIVGAAQKTGGAASDAIFTLPASYRPGANVPLATYAFNGSTWQSAVLLVTPAGVVNLASGGSIAAGNANLLNVSFQAEQ